MRNYVPASWEEISLDSLLVAVEAGSRPKGGVAQIEEGVPSIGGEHLDPQGGFRFEKLRFVPEAFAEHQEHGWIEQGDILVVKDGATTGKTSFVSAEFPFPRALVNEHVLRLAAVSNMSREYLFYFLWSQEGHTEILKDFHGTAQGGISRAFPSKVQVPIAPGVEQHRIVEAIESYLTRLDAAVASLERVQKSLKRYRASVLKAAVEGRLVPTEAELAKKEGRSYEPASELLKRILDERRKKWIENAAENARAKAEEKARKAGKPWTHADDIKTLKKERVKAAKKYKEPAVLDTTNLSDLPEGWCWATVANLSFDVTYGSSSKTSNEGTDGVPVLRMGNIAEGRIDLSDLKYLPQEHSEFPRLFLAPGDLLFNRTNSAELVGKTAVYRGQPSPCSFASYLIRVRLTEGSESEYVAAYINSAFGRQWISSVVSQQVGQANVNGTKLRACVIPLSPIQEQKRISSTLEETLTLVKSIENTVEDAKRRSSKLRQSILKWAFEGKLVEQDPNDEPASVLLERIKAGRKSMQPRKRRRTGKRKNVNTVKHDGQLDLLGGSNK